jgi:hypothetical protein
VMPWELYEAVAETLEVMGDTLRRCACTR